MTKPSCLLLSLALILPSGTAVAGDAEMLTAAKLEAWHRDKADLGPTFSGSPAWTAHLNFIEDELRQRGIEETGRRVFQLSAMVRE